MNKLLNFFGKNRPSILTFAGVGGLIVTAVMAYKSAEVVQSNYHEMQNNAWDEEREPTKKEIAWVYVKSLWPTFTLGAVSVALVIAGDRGHIKRTHGALAAYYISETALKDYQEEVIKEIGEKKEREIKDRVSKKRIEKVPASEQTIIISDGDKPWVFDSETECYFRYGYDKLNWIITQANLDMEEERVDGISVWDLYDRLQVKPPCNERWGFVGWNKKYKIDPYFTSTVTEIMGQMTPCMVMEYRVKPMYDYDAYA